MKADFLTNATDLDALREEWCALQRAYGKAFATSPAFFFAWRDTLGRASVWQPFVVTLRDAKNALTALCPLAIVHKKGFRILKGLPNALYFQADLLAIDENSAHDLVQAIRTSRLYDLAWIEDVDDRSLLAKYLAQGSRVPRRTTSYVADLTMESEEAWLQSRSSKLRGNLRRALAKLGKEAPLTFTAHRDYPTADLDAFIDRKIAWAHEQGKDDSFLVHPQAAAFLRAFAHTAADRGALLFTTLASGATTIAWNLCYLAGGTIYCMAMTHHPHFAAFSPGSLVWMKTIFWGIANGFVAYDMMPHGGFQKESFAATKPMAADYRYVRTAKGWFLEALFRLREAVRARRQERSSDNCSSRLSTPPPARARPPQG
jgi:CelD/BcsL family acetyltransferase involved in cellulose biosynthesis